MFVQKKKNFLSVIKIVFSICTSIRKMSEQQLPMGCGCPRLTRDSKEMPKTTVLTKEFLLSLAMKKGPAMSINVLFLHL